MTVDVNGQSFSASYGQNDSSSTIASKLAADLNRSSSFVTATASGSTVNFTSRQAGAAVDYSTSASSEQGSNASLFSGPSFTASANGSSMSGGAISAGNGTKLYSYSIPAGGYDKNSNLLKVSDSVLGGWSYNYDNLNRLSSATVTSGSYAGANIGGATMSWSYDNFGNRSAQSAANTAALTSSWAHYSTGNNRMTATNSATGGLSYDLSGDVLFDGTHDYLYDAEGRICASAPASAPGIPQLPGTGYIYGPDGERVAKGTITSWSCSRTTNGFSTTENYILGPSNEQLSVTDGSGNWKHSNVYAAGKLLATYDANGAHYNLNDWLGTKRVQVSASGTVDETCWSQPFGDNLNCLGPVADDDNLHFTSKQRDTETGNDYFDARYYASSVGRFMSPDWSAKEEPVPYAKLDDPQSLNLYAYVRNNPLSRTDPDGHCDDDDDACLAVGDSLSGTPFNNLSLGGLIRGTVNAALSLFDIAGDCGAKCTDHSNDPKTPQESQENSAGAIVLGLAGGALALPEAAPAEAEAATARGLSSEARVLDSIGETKNTKPVSTSEGTSIPDFQNSKVVGEIKDTKTVSNTRQLRIQKGAAQQSNRTHRLITGNKTKVTKNAARNTTVVRRKDLGPQ